MPEPEGHWYPIRLAFRRNTSDKNDTVKQCIHAVVPDLQQCLSVPILDFESAKVLLQANHGATAPRPVLKILDGVFVAPTPLLPEVDVIATNDDGFANLAALFGDDAEPMLREFNLRMSIQQHRQRIVGSWSVACDTEQFIVAVNEAIDTAFSTQAKASIYTWLPPHLFA